MCPSGVSIRLPTPLIQQSPDTEPRPKEAVVRPFTQPSAPPHLPMCHFDDEARSANRFSIRLNSSSISRMRLRLPALALADRKSFNSVSLCASRLRVAISAGAPRPATPTFYRTPTRSPEKLKIPPTVQRAPGRESTSGDHGPTPDIQTTSPVQAKPLTSPRLAAMSINGQSWLTSCTKNPRWHLDKSSQEES